MRGLFTAGVLDVMMEHGVKPDGLIGVSAGACFGCNYKSGQAGRAIRYNMRFARDRRYCGIGSLLKTGDIFNADFAYHVVPTEYDIFDNEAFARNPMEFHLVCTDVTTGKAVYKKCDCGGHDFLEWVRASASMPIVSRVVNIGGRLLLDGGVTDSIPLEHFESIGYDRNIVILTQPDGYVKRPLRLKHLMRLFMRKYPKMAEAWERRHIMYNDQLQYVGRAESEGRCLVIRPDAKLPIGHICHNPDKMRNVYDMGRKTGERYINKIMEYFDIKPH